MTLGEKLKEARKNAGLTQEQMAEKLMVSRPAIAKWEGDRGIPDIENLKAISQLLDVSIDYLLNDNQNIDVNLIKEPIDLTKYGKGSKKTRKDKLLKERYPEANIYNLLVEKKLTKGEKIADNILLFTDAGPGIPDILNSIKMLDKHFYLVEQDKSQYLVLITNEFIEIKRMIETVDTKYGSRFQIGDYVYKSYGNV